MTTETHTPINWRGIVRTGLAYGGGLTLGNVLSQLLFTVISPEPYGELGQGLQLAIGIILVLLISGLGGAVGGFLGGRTLPVIGEPKGKYGFAWRSAISVGVIYGTILLIASFALGLLGMRDAAFMPAGPFAKAFLLVGLIVGAFVGLLLGLTTVGWRRTGSVMLASTAGFGLGGIFLGISVWAYFRDAPAGGVYQGNHLILLLGIFALGLLGGLGIGYAYDRLARREAGYKPRQLPRWVRYAAAALVGVFAIWLVSQLLPQLEFVAEYLTPRWFVEADTTESNTEGVHWLVSTPLAAGSAEVSAVDVAAGPPGDVAVVWAEDGAGIYVRYGRSEDGGEPEWGAPIDVSSTAAALEPRVAIDDAGDVHVAWLEDDGQSAYYARCADGACGEPVLLSDAGLACPAGSADTATAAIDIAAAEGAVMVVWAGDGGLFYNVLPDGQHGCVPTPDGVAAGEIALANDALSGFALAFEGDGKESVWLATFAGGDWDESPGAIGRGAMPGLAVTGDGIEVVTWCDLDGGVELWSGGQTEILSELSCLDDPQVATGEDGRLHVVWRSDQVEDGLGQVRQQDVLYETIGDGATWTEPMIVALLEAPSGHRLAGDPAGALHLAWNESDPGIHYALQEPYKCDPAVLSGAEVALHEVARNGGYRPEDDIIPFCGNHYEEILFTPGVDAAFSDKEPTLNGGYDDYARLLQTADYEVLFATMAYSKAFDKDSPGAVLARGIVDLYEEVKANPENYPRGMTVRLLLGNSPTPNFELMESDGGLWYIVKDLKEAGLETMVDPDIGWRVEVGNYSGRYPYSHVKHMIIDGETVVASGFNHEYKPLPKDHPSGYGYGDTDTALVITGPVAQQARQVHDQLWTGAITRHCPDLQVSEAEARLTCSDSRGVPDHAPEAMRYAVSGDDDIAFSMFRNPFYDEADQQIVAAFDAAEESIDLAQAMFSMELICNLNHFFDVCAFDQALPFMEALMDAAERGAKVRIILTPYPIQSLENVVAMDIFMKEAAERGIADRVELRMYDDLLHSKSALIDGDLVIIGSQNLHWSGIGPGVGLNEYNLAVGDEEAAEQYRLFFEYIWNRAPHAAMDN